MKTNFKTWSVALVAAASFNALGSTSQAQTYAEVGDAGDTLATAQTVTGAAGTTVTTITGSIGSLGTDADLYVIDISSPSTFSATTNNAGTNTFTSAKLPLDTALFLFNSSGVEIATNDDTSGTNVKSTLAAGNTLYASLPMGTYYLGISISGNEPVNAANQLLFALSDDPTNVRGPETANNLGPQSPTLFTGTTLSGFNQDNYDNETGAYTINLIGVNAIPEPAAWAWIALGGGVAGYLSSRRRKMNRV